MYKFSIFLTIAVVALGAALSLSVQYGIKKNADCRRLATNQSALLSQVERYTVRDSLNAVSVRALTLRNSELDAYFSSITSLVRDMGIKIKNLENVSQNATQTTYHIQTPVRDSTAIDRSVQLINYHDRHLSLRGVIDSSQFRGEIVCLDTLTQIIHRVPRKFWFIRWGVKELRQEIVSTNPHTKITYSQSIRLTR